MLNDTCVRLRKPVIFSSVYQYEGQLQVVRPERGGACLRCVWPEATRDGLVGNCAEAGVLGPVPGTFGSLQALEALKLLLDLPGQLAEELLVIDLLTLSVTRVRTRRAPDCPGHARGTARRPAPMMRVELRLPGGGAGRRLRSRRRPGAPRTRATRHTLLERPAHPHRAGPSWPAGHVCRRTVSPRLRQRQAQPRRGAGAALARLRTGFLAARRNRRAHPQRRY